MLRPVLLLLPEVREAELRGNLLAPLLDARPQSLASPQMLVLGLLHQPKPNCCAAQRFRALESETPEAESWHCR